MLQRVRVQRSVGLCRWMVLRFGHGGAEDFNVLVPIRGADPVLTHVWRWLSN